MAANPYDRVLSSHALVLVPTDSPICYYAHSLRPMDRIQIFNEVWTHSHFDGTSWLVTSRTRGNDPASLDAYLGKYLRQHHLHARATNHLTQEDTA